MDSITEKVTKMEPLKKKPRWVKNLLILMLAAVLAFGAALYMDSRISMMFKKTVSLEAGKTDYINYKEEGERIISASEDPQILLHGLDGAFSGVTIYLREPLESDCLAQLFYGFRDRGFSEKYSKRFWLEAGSMEIVLPMDGVATDVRIDIGAESGIILSISEIKMNPADKTLGVLGKILTSGRFWVRFELLFLLFALIGCYGIFGIKGFHGILYRYRWYLGLFLILFFTVNKLHGDSIAAYDSGVQPGMGSEFVQPVFGEPRHIRSDEWVSDTPKRLSSRFLAEPCGKYNDLIRGTETVNPVYAGVGNLGRLGYSPFGIFYRLLGVEYGYYFEWNAATILTLLFTFEFFLILTKKNKLLSVLGTALVVFSSFHLWWCIPSFLLYIHAIVVFFHYFFTTKSKKVKLLCAVGEPIAVANFATIFYPAWQVPAGYMLLALVVWLVHEDWESIKSQKKEAWMLFGAALVFCAVLVVSYVFSISDRLEGQLTTVYPGHRVSTGGEGSLKLFYYFQSFLYPFRSFGNPSEAGTFCSLFPLPFLAGLVYTVRTKKRNWLIFGLLLVGLILTVYVYVGFPLWLSKATFLSYSPSERAMDFVSLINVYLLVVLFCEKEEQKWNLKWPVGLAVSGVVVFASLYVCQKTFPGYMTGAYMILLLVILSLFGMSFLSSMNLRLYRGILALVILLCTATGLLVRPFQRGLDAIDSKPLAEEIRAVNEEDPGQKWVAVSEGNVLQAYVLACGAATVNSINDYPNLELWRKLDHGEIYNDVYNRYAHVVVELCKEETSFELKQDDLFKLNLSYQDLETAGIKYVVSDRRLEADSTEVSFKELYEEAGAYVYQVQGK
jgi:hypothetical protein